MPSVPFLFRGERYLGTDMVLLLLGIMNRVAFFGCCRFPVTVV